jgi:hypothetical protein
MSLDLLLSLSSGWQVLLITGLLLGWITLSSVERRTQLLWFLPVLLLAAVTFLLVTDTADSALLSFIVAWCVLLLRAPDWILVGAPAVVCLLSSPLVGYVALTAVCELTGDCL